MWGMRLSIKYFHNPNPQSLIPHVIHEDLNLQQHHLHRHHHHHHQHHPRQLRFITPPNTHLKTWYSVLKPIDPDPHPGPSRLGARWPDFQGAQDWTGLLDPLDNRLRAEILRYGDFNEAAYKAFEFDPTSPSYASCRFPKRTLLEDAGFPYTGYRLTRHLRATSGIRLPNWAGPPQSNWATMQSSWIGYVAVCQDKAEISRLGRRDVVISLRGTATFLEWLENLRATLALVSDPGPEPDDDPPMVEAGFLSLYTSGSESLQDSIRDEVGRLLTVYSNEPEPLSITLTGHSLGAALVTLAAYDIKTTFKRAPLVTVMSFGGPRVGNRSFRSLVEKLGIKILRIVNPNDLITKVPGIIIDNDYQNNSNDNVNDNNNNNILDGSGFKFEFGFWSSWIQKRVEDTQTQWAYAEVGCELKLRSEEEKDNQYELNLAKCHDLKTYLQLVKGLSAKCPFRAKASQFLSKIALTT